MQTICNKVPRHVRSGKFFVTCVTVLNMRAILKNKGILNNMSIRPLIFGALGIFFALPIFIEAQEVHQELQETVRAIVLAIEDEFVRDIVGTDTEAFVQEVRVRVEEGLRKGAEGRFENDLTRLEVGDSVYVNRLVSISGVEYYTFKDTDRTRILLLLGLCFIGVLVLFSGFQGARALLSLGLSVLLLFFVLVPLLLKGYSPFWVSLGVAGPILALTLFLTHGVRSTSIIACIGTFGAVVVTALLSHTWVTLADLTGLSSDAAIYLNFGTQGRLDFGGLLLGSIIIGILGILDDVAITQASVVGELKCANPALHKRALYLSALKVGRDHVGSLVNTLSFAYIGASLPLVLLLTLSTSDVVLSINQEIVAVELIRIFLGSIGLILAVPFTTLVAVWWYERYNPPEGERYGHSHAHHAPLSK